jgi:peptidoglycan/xylan/chitin deacetylase (PgdA/CDA1 family)
MSANFMLKNFAKSILSSVFGSKFFFDTAEKISKIIRKPILISVTYHDTPKSDSDNFRKQLNWYKSKYDNCTLEDLQLFLEKGVWLKRKPGIIITFDDGLASNYLYASEILESYGFTGWFMVPAGIIDLPENDHLHFAQDGLVDFSFLEGQKRLFMSRHELLDLRSRGHQIVCHSYSHVRLSEDLSSQQINTEVKLAKKRLEDVLGERVNSFAWVGGEEHAYSKPAMRAMEDAGYKLVFATNCSPIYPNQNSMFLERYHVDVKYNLNEIRLAISWIYNMLYLAKRNRVRNIFSPK